MQSRIANGVRNWMTGEEITDTGCSLEAAGARRSIAVRLFTGMHRFLPTLVRSGRRASQRDAGAPPAPPLRRPQVRHPNRLFRGLADLFAVRWMQRRWIDRRLVEEITAWTYNPSGSPVGFFGQALFSARFFVQWIASERRKRSVVPNLFWFFSIGGGSVLLAYAIHRRDPVFAVGKAGGLMIYLRNIWLIYRQPNHQPPTLAPPDVTRQRRDLLQSRWSRRRCSCPVSAAGTCGIPTSPATPKWLARCG